MYGQFSSLELKYNFRSFTQLIYDHQFSPLYLTLVAEVARIQSILSSDAVRVHNQTHCQENSSRDTFPPVSPFPPKLFEDFGKAVGRSNIDRDVTNRDCSCSVHDAREGCHNDVSSEAGVFFGYYTWTSTPSTTMEIDVNIEPSKPLKVSTRRRPDKGAGQTNSIEDIFAGLE